MNQSFYWTFYVRPQIQPPTSTEATMFVSQTDIEAAIHEGVVRFEQEHMGRQPREIQVHLVVVRLKGALAAGEQLLAKTLPGVTGVRVLSLHHDVSTVTGEEVVLFTLAQPTA
jgi:uncharacterized protein YbcI